jgi:hypothetical protein
VLCPVEFTEHDFVEPAKPTPKKKNEKDREKDRVERELAQKAADYYRKRQEETNRPVNPREPLKRTADNNWVHVTCAVWTPEVKFGSAKALGPSEGIPSIPRARYDEVCKACRQNGGACIACHHCRAPVHVECAHQAGYLLGFEITPVKGSRRDQFNIVSINGETGTMSAAIWCKEHIPTRTVVHRMHDPVNQSEIPGKNPSALNALQLFVQNFKQADLALTGTVRKANLIAMATKTPAAVPPVNANRRASTTAGHTNGSGSQRSSSIDHQTDTASVLPESGDKVCITCGIDVSPKWWPIEKSQERVLINGHYGNLGSEAQKFVDQRNVQCHKCKKADRKPVAHSSPPPDDPAPQIEPVMAPPTITALASPPPAAVEPRPPVAPFAWAPPPPAAPQPSGPPPAPSSGPASAAPPNPPPVVAPLMQAPLAGPPPPLPLNAPHPGQSPIAAPVTQPGHHHYHSPSTPYSDWHRTTTQHSPPIPPMNGGPAGPSSLHNHLRDLRPPPITPISHHQGPPHQHGTMGQPVVNGLPPSPRRMPPVQNGTVPYLASYHHQTHHSLHNLTNGGPPPRAGEHSFSQGLLSQRPPFQPPLGSPPISRDGLAMSREPSLSNANPPPRPSDGRSPSGASASPSLRNLLS